jgi:hypothetical protein
MNNEQLLVPFPASTPGAVQPATQFRNSWLWSPLRALKARDLLRAYIRHLPPEHHEAVLWNDECAWLPIEVALAHYRACDALDLPPEDVVAMGRDVTNVVPTPMHSRLLGLARGVGVTPWHVLEQVQGLWDRVWLGGGVSVVKLGPTKARIEIAGWPCAESPSCRAGLRGAIEAVTDLFCTRSYARELPERATPTSLAYVLSWA